MNPINSKENIEHDVQQQFIESPRGNTRKQPSTVSPQLSPKRLKIDPTKDLEVRVEASAAAAIEEIADTPKFSHIKQIKTFLDFSNLRSSWPNIQQLRSTIREGV